MNKLLRCMVPAATLALACWSATAAAQSSVQLYGLVDAWAGAKKALGSQNAFVQSNGGMTASFWGIRGTEDLGNGYQAIFELESYFSVQNGTYGRFAGDGFFSRNAWVGVQAPWGRLVAGQMGPLYWNATIFFNPLFNSFVFSPAVIQTYVGVNGQGVGGGGGEWSNAVTYTSTAHSGLKFAAQYAFGNDPGHLGQNKWAAQVLYNRGPFAATAVYQQIKFNSAPGDLAATLPGLTTQTAAQIGASYDFGALKLYGQYQYVLNAITTGNLHVNVGQIGASLKLGVGRILASDAYSKSGGQGNASRNTWALAYDYPLSRRTDIYGAFLVDRATYFSTGHTLGLGVRTVF